MQVAKLVYYEYVQQPCVQQLFYDKAKTVSSKAGSKGGTLCANPLLPVAAAACCEKAEDDKSAYSSVTYDGERMTFASAVSRCDKASMEACNFDKIAEISHKLSSFYWTLDECSIKIKVNSEGHAFIVHQPDSYTEKILHVSNQNQNWLKVYWHSNGFPMLSMSCNGVCKAMKNVCVCNARFKKKSSF